ncbi:MAG: permease prefix domain 1-containing protein [Candidatus Limnocylindrales bacterium]|jgi:hypothetical protein
MLEPDAAHDPNSSPDETPLPAEIDEYLRRLGAALDLPAHVRAEIASEMAGHFRDSIAAIESEGLDPELAAREAIARLGSPTELAAELTSAHRTTRRLLVGAAGGVFHASLGAAGGLLLGIAIVAAAVCGAAVVTGTLLRPPTEFVYASLPALRAAIAGLPMVTALLSWACCLAAFVAARRGVAVSTRISRRTPAAVRRIWAIAGFVTLFVAAVFVVSAPQNLLSALSLLAVPFAFAAGALTNSTPRVSLPRGKAIAAICVLAILSASFARNVPAWSGPPPDVADTPQAHAAQLREFDRVAPAWAYVDGRPVLAEGGGLWGSGVIRQAVGILDPDPWSTSGPAARALSQFKDVRFEAWRAVRFDASPDIAEWIPDPAYSAPYATATADFNTVQFGPGHAEVEFNVGRVRTTEWIVFVTGIGPDGRRYRLNEPEFNMGGGPLVSSFTGTIWQWLTAST